MLNPCAVSARYCANDSNCETLSITECESLGCQSSASTVMGVYQYVRISAIPGTPNVSGVDFFTDAFPGLQHKNQFHTPNVLSQNRVPIVQRLIHHDCKQLVYRKGIVVQTREYSLVYIYTRV